MVDRELLALAPKKKSFLWGLTGVLGLAAGLLAAGQAGCLAWIVELAYLQKAGLKQVMPRVGLLLFLFALRLLTHWGREVAAFRFALQVEEGLREALFRQFVNLGPLAGLETKAGEKVCLLLDKVEAVSTYFHRYLPLLVTAGTVAFVLLLFALATLPVTGLIFLVSTLAAVALLILIGKWGDGKAQERWKLMGYLNSYFLDLLQGLVTLKLFGRSREHGEKIWLLGDRFRVATMEVLRVTFLSALVLELVTTLGTAMVAVTVSLRLLAGKMPFFPAFFLILLTPEYYLALRQLSQRYHVRLAGVAAAQEIAAYLNLAPPVSRPSNTLPPPSGPLEITFREVTYAYREKGEPVLKGVSFTLLPGEKVALLGPTGAGKSTLAYLLLRFADPQEGEILVNRLLLKEIDPEEWRRQVSFLPQQPRLWPGTVWENLALDGSVPRERVEEVLELLGLRELLSSLPQGYATPLGEGGVGLSGGQVQRLALARVLLRPAPLLLLDEPTTGLDPESELAFFQALETLAQDKTVLLITHHLNVLEHVDRVLLLQEGRLVEAGRPEELKKSPGVLLPFLQAYGGNGYEAGDRF